MRAFQRLQIAPTGSALKAFMFATVAALLLACKPYHPPMPPPPPPPVTVRCEGPDQVSRSFDGDEVRRVPNACTVVQCEGADSVRRSYDGQVVWRTANACVVTRCEGTLLVQRTRDGRFLNALEGHRRCVPDELPRFTMARPEPVLRYGLSAR